MAPEQAAGDRARVGPPADIFALGGTCTCSGQAGRRPVRIRRRPSSGRFSRCSQTTAKKSWPAAFRLEPCDRYPSAAALADDLRRFLEGRPIKAKQPSAWERTVKWGRAAPVDCRFDPVHADPGHRDARHGQYFDRPRARRRAKAALARAIEQEKRRTGRMPKRLAFRANELVRFYTGSNTVSRNLSRKWRTPISPRNSEYATMRRVVITEAIQAYQGFLSAQAANPNPGEVMATCDSISPCSTPWLTIMRRAQDAYREAIKIAECLKDDDPSFSSWYCVGQTHSHLGMELWDVGKTEGSIPHFRAASKAFHRAVELETRRTSSFFNRPRGFSTWSRTRDFENPNGPGACPPARRRDLGTGAQ